jgi:hypothetical protein
MNDEVIYGPDADILVPDEVPELRPVGFLLRFSHLDEPVLEMLAPCEGASKESVIARLVFTGQGFQRFVDGLRAVQHDLNIGYQDGRTP